MNAIKIFRKLSNKTLSLFINNDKFKNKISKFIREIRRVIKAFKTKNLKINIDLNLIIRVIKKLIIKKEILKHENKRLKEILIKKKKRRKRGKIIKLFFKNKAKQVMFFFSSKIAVTRIRQKKFKI